MGREEAIHSSETICVGTELLMGHTLNTNSAYIARELADMGIPSFRQIVIGDNPSRLASQIRESVLRSDLVILTGGLGPTKDDLTMATAADVAGVKLIFHENIYKEIADYFVRIGKNMPESNKKQAYLPEDAVILPNTNGTAPGAMFYCPAPKRNEPSRQSLIVLLPGPPSELIPMFTISVRPHLQKLAPFHFRTQYVHLFGMGESDAETRIIDLIEAQDNPTIAPYAAEGECMFRVTQRIESDSDPDLMTPVIEEMKKRFGSHIYEIGSRSMKEIVFSLLQQKKMTVSFAESCTAGMISSEFSDIPGVSQVFMGSVVSYDNQVKMKLLGVTAEVLEKYGAVSEQCAVMMAHGCRQLLNTDISVSVTGIAGPDGGTPDKPVGLVYIAIADEKETKVLRYQATGNRMRIRRVATLQALNLIRERLI